MIQDLAEANEDRKRKLHQIRLVLETTHLNSKLIDVAQSFPSAPPVAFPDDQSLGRASKRKRLPAIHDSVTTNPTMALSRRSIDPRPGELNKLLAEHT